MPDILEYIAFEWYKPVYNYDKANFPEDCELICKWIGVAHNVGQAVCFWILSKSGTPITRTTVRNVSDTEQHTDEFKAE